MNSTSKGTIPHYDLYGRVLPSTKFILWRFKLHIPKPIYLSRVPLLCDPYMYTFHSAPSNEYKSVDNRPSHSWYFIWRFKTFCAKYYILLSPTTHCSCVYNNPNCFSEYASERVSDIYYCYGWVLPEEPRGISDTWSRKNQPKTKMNAWLWWS